jgi:hypothetical protein
MIYPTIATIAFLVPFFGDPTMRLTGRDGKAPPIKGSFRDVQIKSQSIEAGDSELHQLPRVSYAIVNVNPGLINHGLLIRGYSSNSHNMILKWSPPN